MERQHLSKTKKAICLQRSTALRQAQEPRSRRSQRFAIASSNRESALAQLTEGIAQYPTHPIEELQGAIGNRAVNQLLANQPIVQAKPMFRGLSGELAIQPKLTIGKAEDKYEQEADYIASQVTKQINAPSGEAIQQKEIPQKENQELVIKPMVQRLSDGCNIATSSGIEASINQAKGRGQPLPANILQPMQKAFGADFSGVKIHNDTQSHQLNQSIQAKAFTTGRDIFFEQGTYNPESLFGQELIAHELTHVVQQSSGLIKQAPRQSDALTAPIPLQSVDTSSGSIIQRRFRFQSTRTRELHEAIVAQDKDRVKRKLAKGADPNYQAEDGQRPLQKAITSGNFQIFHLLISYGADASLTDDKGNTSLHTAAFEGDVDMVLALAIGKKVDIDRQNKDGNTPLMHCLTNPIPKQEVETWLVDMLETNLALTNTEGKTALHLAAQHRDDVNLINNMISKGANPSATDSIGWTPYTFAVAAANPNVENQLRTTVPLAELGPGYQLPGLPIDAGQKYDTTVILTQATFSRNLDIGPPQIKQIYEELYAFPEFHPIMDLAASRAITERTASQETLRIFIAPTEQAGSITGKGGFGAFNPSNTSIVLGSNRTDQIEGSGGQVIANSYQTMIGSLIHELTHHAALATYNNDTMPFARGDTTRTLQYFQALDADKLQNKVFRNLGPMFAQASRIGTGRLDTYLEGRGFQPVAQEFIVGASQSLYHFGHVQETSHSTPLAEYVNPALFNYYRYQFIPDVTNAFRQDPMQAHIQSGQINAVLPAPIIDSDYVTIGDIIIEHLVEDIIECMLTKKNKSENEIIGLLKKQSHVQNLFGFQPTDLQDLPSRCESVDRRDARDQMTSILTKEFRRTGFPQKVTSEQMSKLISNLANDLRFEKLPNNKIKIKLTSNPRGTIHGWALSLKELDRLSQNISEIPAEKS